jgi:ATPase subunit of ABC transporter with duplicated ATPase domains
MISVSNITMRYGAKVLFEEVSTTFTNGRRYGLTGPNGAGKSTFMKILAGDLDPQKGNVVRPRKLSVLRQDQYAFDAFRVIDTVIMGNKGLWAALEERDKIYEKSELTDADGMRLAELEGTVGEEDGYTAESDAAILLQGLDIEDSLHERKMGELQGGEKFRVLLAQALFGKPQALLLDEPTNYLDLDSIHWLQDFLSRFEGTLITISHDRHFLNSVCTHIADIDYQTIITYTGGYDDMVMAKSSVRNQIEQDNAEKEKKISQLQDFVARFSAGTRASQVQSRKKALEKLQLMELKRSNIERPFIRFEPKRPSGKQTLTVEGLTKRWPGVTVCDNFDALLMRGEKVAVIGRNGVGKTTLCKLFLGELHPDEGSVTWGHEAQVGYLAQDHREGIALGTTVADWLHDIDPRAGNEDIRGLLGRMLFKGEEGLKSTNALSGGEAVRLILAKLMLTRDNVLILDEPTNHLDLESIIALGDALQRFPGTAIVASHDRDLIGSFATRLFAFTPAGLVDFQGTYEEFLEKVGDTDVRQRRDGTGRRR